MGADRRSLTVIPGCAARAAEDISGPGSLFAYVDPKQKTKKVGIMQYGVAHLGGLLALVTGDSSSGVFLIKIPRWGSNSKHHQT